MSGFLEVPIRPCRDNGGAIVLCKLLISGVGLRVITACFDDATFKIIGHHHFGGCQCLLLG